METLTSTSAEAPANEGRHEREARLKSLIFPAFEELIPANGTERALHILCLWEDDARSFMGEPKLALTSSDLGDDFRSKLEPEFAIEDTKTELAVLTAAVESGVENRDQFEAAALASIDHKKAQQWDTSLAQSVRERALKQEANTAADLETVQDLQSQFDTLKAQHGTRGALALLLEPGILKTAAMRALVKRALKTVDALTTALPGKANVVADLLNHAGLKLGASSPAIMFGGFMGAVETSPDLTEADKETLRNVIFNEQAIETGRDVRVQTLTTVTDPETGDEVAAYPPDNPRQIRPGVMSYTETGTNVVLRFDGGTEPPQTYDVTGWTDGQIGMLTETLSFDRALRDAGLKVLSDLIIDHDLLGQDAPLDQTDIKVFRRVFQALLGPTDSTGGHIFDPTRHRNLLRYTAKLLAPAHEQTDPHLPLRLLGLLDEQNQLGFGQLQRVGTFARTSIGLGHASQADLKRYLGIAAMAA